MAVLDHRLSGKYITATVLAERRAFYKAARASRGRFESHRELIGFIAEQRWILHRSREEIADDASISLDVLHYLFGANKVPYVSADTKKRR